MDMAETQDLFAAALADPSLPVPACIRGGPRAAARFAVYRNNVAVGLGKALASNFPVTESLVGREFFARMAQVWAATHRPASPLLFSYGEGFADFIAGFGPAAGLPYLSDVARLEFARLGAYHAADLPVLTVATLAGLDAETLVSARLARHPASKLLVSTSPVGSIWLAHQNVPVAAVTAKRGEHVLVTRRGVEVSVCILAEPERVFARALLAGLPIGEAASQAGSDPRFDFGRALVDLVGRGTFQDLSLSPRPTAR
jgi:hypothetical protein